MVSTSWDSGNPIPNPSSAWSNDPVVGNVTNVRKAHLQELREVMDLHSSHYHIFDGYTSTNELPDVSFSWVVPIGNIVPDVTKISVAHWTELRTAVSSADNHYHFVPGLNLNSDKVDLNIPGAWSAGMTEGSKPKKDHIDELRTSMALLHNHTHTCCCDSECICQCTCTCQCQENCCSQCWWFD